MIKSIKIMSKQRKNTFVNVRGPKKVVAMLEIDWQRHTTEPHGMGQVYVRKLRQRK